MKLYLLRPNTEMKETFNMLWDPWYDKAFGFVVRERSEQLARIKAAEQAGDEKYVFINDDNTDCNPWLDKELTSCILLTEHGEAGVIIKDYKHG